MASNAVAKVTPKPKGDNIFARIYKFLRESYNETFKKSAWPSAQELRQFTIVVIVALIIVTVWIGGFDFLFGRITEILAR